MCAWSNSAVPDLDIQHSITVLSHVARSLARENIKLREHARDKPVQAPVATSNDAKSISLPDQQAASDSTPVSSTAIEFSQTMYRGPEVVLTRTEGGTDGSFEAVTDLDVPEGCHKSEWCSAAPIQRLKGREVRPVEHESEAPDDLLDTAILEWQNLCESLSADVLRSEQKL